MNTPSPMRHPFAAINDAVVVLADRCEQLRRTQLDAAHATHQRHVAWSSHPAYVEREEPLGSDVTALAEDDLRAATQYWVDVMRICGATGAKVMGQPLAVPQVGATSATVIPTWPPGFALTDWIAPLAPPLP